MVSYAVKHQFAKLEVLVSILRLRLIKERLIFHEWSSRKLGQFLAHLPPLSHFLRTKALVLSSQNP